MKEHLDTLAHCHTLKAVRHVVQDEPDDNFLLRDDFNRGIDALGDYWLAYDILIFERHLPQAIEFVDRHPYQTFVLDHLAKPRVKDNELEPWAHQHPPTRRARKRLLQALRPGDRGRLAGLVGAATDAVLGSGARRLRPAAADVRQRLAGLPLGRQLSFVVRIMPTFRFRPLRRRAEPASSAARRSKRIG